jgi:hypothetical protein
MSVLENSRYRVADRGSSLLRFAVMDDHGRALHGAPGLVDVYRTRSGAEHAASLLNRGVARVEPHAVLGCRVVPDWTGSER